jgi:hypothetical protein
VDDGDRSWPEDSWKQLTVDWSHSDYNRGPGEMRLLPDEHLLPT